MKAVAHMEQSDASRRNKTEQAFWEMQLIRKRAGETHDCLWEPFNLRLADNTFYKPDCVVIGNDGRITVYEVKGFWRDDARVKIKVAARQHYYLKFVAVSRKRGEWKYEVI